MSVVITLLDTRNLLYYTSLYCIGYNNILLEDVWHIPLCTAGCNNMLLYTTANTRIYSDGYNSVSN